MFKRIILLAFILLLSFNVSGCVTKKTFELKEEEVKVLEKNNGDLERRLRDLHDDYDQLTIERNGLEAEKGGLLMERDRLIADNKDLDQILKAKSDDLSKTIAELRQNIADQKADTAIKVKGYESWGDELGKRISSIMADNAALQDEIKALKQEKEEEVKKMSSTYEELIDKMKGEIDKGQVTISELEGKLTVNMVDAVLFDSGQAEIKDDGLAVLQKVVDILSSVTDKAIRVEGHTDNVKIIGGLAKKYPTNWELSAARAINVTKFLQDQGLDPRNLGAVAYGEYKPVADNETREGRAQNRRIEIVLVAKE